MRIEPLFDRVLCLQVAKPEATDSTIILIEEDKSTVFYEVKETGPDVKNVHKGDIVISSQYAGPNLQVNRVNYKIIPERQLIGRFHAK
jgi:co-chaperonin GroES (HSP10)